LPISARDLDDAEKKYLRDNDKTIDPLPDSFETEEQAGEFWGAHSTMDYQEYLEPSDHTIEISQRVFEVQVAEDLFKRRRPRN
jgi:hypothetical protein